MTLVERDDALADALQDILRQPAVGVDTESNSLYRYHERVCLIQISTDERDYVFDPLSVDVRPLGQLFASREVEKVFHAGDYDVTCLKRDYSFSFRRVFDTMIAARVIGLPRLGLSSLLGEYFGLTLNKRMQRSDWGKRPLDPAHLDYAATDSHYLLSLRAVLDAELGRNGTREAAEAAFVALQNLTCKHKRFDPEGYLRLPGASDLDDSELAVLRELYRWREDTARAHDEPAFRVAGNDALIRLAMLQPQTSQALKLVDGPNCASLLRYGDGVLRAILRGVERGRHLESAHQE